jgi:hypothetical protein
MPMKICSKCGKGSGPRTKKCECGHEFIAVEKTTAVIAIKNDKMTLDLLDKQINESVGAINNIEKSTIPVKSYQRVASKTVTSPILPPTPKVSFLNGRVIAPAGLCPYAPVGYKKGWPEGPASDEVVQNWAIEIYNRDYRYSWEAVIYWARYFWDVHSDEFNRIRSLIMKTLGPQKSNDVDDPSATILQ